jgi:hypothetical protein
MGIVSALGRTQLGIKTFENFIQTDAASAPGALMLPVESGCEELDVHRLDQPADLAEALASVRAFGTEKHEYRTIVIDTIDALETLIFTRLAPSGPVTDYAGGFGKYVQAAIDLGWKPLSDAIDTCTRRGLDVLLLGHSQIKHFADPSSDGWDKYQLKIEQRAAAQLIGFCDCVFFLHLEDLRTKGGIGVSTGRRVCETQHSAAWVAKQRLGLPAQIEIARGVGWRAITDAVERYDACRPLRAEVANLCASAPIAIAERAGKALAGIEGDRAALEALVAKVREALK